MCPMNKEKKNKDNDFHTVLYFCGIGVDVVV